MFMAEDDTRKVFEADVGTHDLSLRAFTTIDEPFEILVGNQRRGYIPPRGRDSSRSTEKCDTKSFAHGHVIFATWPRHPQAASNKRPAPALA